MKTTLLKVSDEFVVGRHNIGWVDSDFKDKFYGQEFTPNVLGKFQKLGSYMANADEIETKLNPGRCTLADVYAFLQNPPKESKDGWSNLFLVEDKVVSLFWYSEFGFWFVYTWYREFAWLDDNRVFSPGFESQSLGNLDSSTLESQEKAEEFLDNFTKELKAAIRLVKKHGYTVSKIM